MKKWLVTHPRFMDIYMEIVKVVYRDEKRVKAKVLWWNKGYTGNPWLLFDRPTVEEFPIEKWNEFIPYSSPSEDVHEVQDSDSLNPNQF